MPALEMEPTYRVVLGDADAFRILLVGVGGTGSTLALFLAGLAYHAREQGIRVELTLVDPDYIEPPNVGRQACKSRRGPERRPAQGDQPGPAPQCCLRSGHRRLARKV